MFVNSEYSYYAAMANPTAFFRNYCSIVKCVHGELICLCVLSVYVCQNNEQNHVTVDTLAHVIPRPYEK